MIEGEAVCDVSPPGKNPIYYPITEPLHSSPGLAR